MVLIVSCSQPLTLSQTIAPDAPQESRQTPYDRSALQNLKWLAGAWKCTESGHDLTQSFLFHTPQILEVSTTEAGTQKATQYFSWKDGHYYYGQSRQWILTWISDKNIRFDPTVPGLQPMTWSRVHQNEWHLIRHTDKGDETTIMVRSDLWTS